MAGCKDWKSRMLQSVGNKMKRSIMIFSSGIFMLVLCLTWAAPRQIGPQPEEFYFKNNFNQQQSNEENLVETSGLIQNKIGVVSSVSDLINI